METGQPDSRARSLILEARGLVKQFGHVHALRQANFEVRRNEVVALIGDNGAGKSTLVKILSGALKPDSGTILVEGKEVQVPNPMTARELGIQTVYQDLALANELDAVANLYLGREIPRPGVLGRMGFLDHRKMRAHGESLFRDLGVQIPDTKTRVSSLSGGQRQGVAVSRAIAWATSIVIMDEPTAALGVVQTQNVLELIDRVRGQGRSVVLVSHNMPQVLEAADRVEVFRLGRRVARFSREDVTLENMIAAMTGALVTEPE